MERDPIVTLSLPVPILDDTLRVEAEHDLYAVLRDGERLDGLQRDERALR